MMGAFLTAVTPTEGLQQKFLKVNVCNSLA